MENVDLLIGENEIDVNRNKWTADLTRNMMRCGKKVVIRDQQAFCPLYCVGVKESK